MLSSAGIVAYAMKYNRQKWRVRGSREIFKARNAALFSIHSIVITPSLNINYIQRPLEGRTWKLLCLTF